MPIQFTNLPHKQVHWDKLNKQCIERCVAIGKELMLLKRSGNARYHSYKRMVEDCNFLIDWELIQEKWGNPIPIEGVDSSNYDSPNGMGPTYVNLVGHGWGEAYWLIHTDQGKWVRIWTGVGEFPEIRGQVYPTRFGDEPYFGKMGV